MRWIILSFSLCFSFVLSAHEFPPPSHTVPLKMEDGAILPIDLFFPPNADPKECPCLLIRSPAGSRHPFLLPYLPLVQAGYVVAIQPTRNALDMEGKTFPFLSDGWHEHRDGYETVEWLAESPYCNGKIGTVGASALGITQHMLAPSAPPHLVCQYIMIATPNLHSRAIFPHGQLLKSRAEGWLGLYAPDPGIFNFVAHQPFYNPFWERTNAIEHVEKIQAPAVHYGGWYDIFLEGTIDAFLERQFRGGEGARGKQHLVLGPWTHYFALSDELGDYKVPDAGKAPPVDISMGRWFNYYLKGDENGMGDAPTVLYYVMGPFDGSPSSGNVWRQADAWPIPASVKPYYLHADGKLDETVQAKAEQASFLYDPRNPVPTIGGHNLFLPAGPKDQQAIEQRDDVLVFSTPVLDDDVEVTGDIEAVLYFSTDQKDSDVAIRLCDVYPDGRSVLISDACYRLDVMHHPYEEKSAKGTIPLSCSIALPPTSQVFAKGHRIRLSVTSSNYPRYEKNRNVGLVGALKSEACVAHNTLHLDGETPSQIILPIVRKGDDWLVANQKENTIAS